MELQKWHEDAVAKLISASQEKADLFSARQRAENAVQTATVDAQRSQAQVAEVQSQLAQATLDANNLVGRYQVEFKNRMDNVTENANAQVAQVVYQKDEQIKALHELILRQQAAATLAANEAARLAPDAQLQAQLAFLQGQLAASQQP